MKKPVGKDHLVRFGLRFWGRFRLSFGRRLLGHRPRRGETATPQQCPDAAAGDAMDVMTSLFQLRCSSEIWFAIDEKVTTHNNKPTTIKVPANIQCQINK